MIVRRPAAERGRTELGWLSSRHTFSFGEYSDPQHMGFRSLRVLNDDRVAPRGGFGTHGHRDMEILSYVLAGALQHQDSLGTGSVIKPGEIQFMRAGSGVLHSEYNPSATDPVHFLQIWILPRARGLDPAYAQHAFDRAAAREHWLLLAAGDPTPGAIELAQDARMLVGILDAGDQRSYALAPARHAWIHVAHGGVLLNGTALEAGDGAQVSDESALQLSSVAPASEVLVFDLG
ncbi:MAG TPA: pirin family protein [Candidatus Udaeobacter sp.]|nr:pirin family protein [Candidatus Udaeobacter sp.]